MNNLIERIKEAQEKNKKKSLKKTRFKSSSFRVSVEFVSGIIVGTAAGYWLDNFFKSAPWLLIVGFFFGCATGFYNVYRYSQKVKNEL
jgi:F0F1-type ATP synthase assembly protein I